MGLIISSWGAILISQSHLQYVVECVQEVELPELTDGCATNGCVSHYLEVDVVIVFEVWIDVDIITVDVLITCATGANLHFNAMCLQCPKGVQGCVCKPIGHTGNHAQVQLFKMYSVDHLDRGPQSCPEGL